MVTATTNFRSMARPKSLHAESDARKVIRVEKPNTSFVQLYSRDSGKRAAKFSFHCGQGTQDVGFQK